MKPSKGTDYNENLTAGVLILTVGVVLLLQRMGVFFPGWLFSWPMFLIVIGLIVLVKHRFRSGFGFFMILLGGVFIVKREYPHLVDMSYAIPIGLILLGFYLMVYKKNYRGDGFEGSYPSKPRKNKDPFSTGNVQSNYQRPEESDEDKVDTTIGSQFVDNGDVLHSQALFCGIQKRVLSKNFYGGKISTYFGGTDIDLSQADIVETAYLNIDVAFGGVKLIVPPHWELKIDVTNIFAGIEDKRMYPQSASSSSKVMVIKGSIIFGGLEIKSF